jgi:3-oxoacyl-[acyl-carrier-protein] synthase-3
MPLAAVSNVRLCGLACAVPATTRQLSESAEQFGLPELEKIARNTGVTRRRAVQNQTCASDLSVAAAESLLRELRWDVKSFDALIFVTQTPDFVLPATSCAIHATLGLSASCAAFDVNLGCSGYVYGLWLAANLIAAGAAGRILLLAGDTISRLCSPADRSVACLFGDAGSATALERDSAAPPMHFETGTDGTGYRNLIVPAGGFRKPRTVATAQRSAGDNGNIRSEEDLYMDGGEVFAFTLRTVPQLFERIMVAAGWTRESLDAVVMHQANQFMLQHLIKRLRLPPEKVPIALEGYGNTSSASIPLAMAVALSGKLRCSVMQLILLGFGVGFSWAAGAVICDSLVVPPLIEFGTVAAAGGPER